jgi:hypothetical protein
VLSSGFLLILSGAAAVAMTTGSSGTLEGYSGTIVGLGSTESGTVVDREGSWNVSSSGETTGTIVSSRAFEIVSSSGAPSYITVPSGGTLVDYGGATISGATFSGGAEMLVDGADLSGAVLSGSSFAELIISSGGSPSDITVSRLPLRDRRAPLSSKPSPCGGTGIP